MPSEKEIDEVVDRHAMRLLNLPGVIGVSTEQDETGQFVLAMRVSTDDPAVLERLPKQIEGIPIKWVRSEEYRKLPLKRKTKDKT